MLVVVGNLPAVLGSSNFSFWQFVVVCVWVAAQQMVFQKETIGKLRKARALSLQGYTPRH